MINVSLSNRNSIFDEGQFDDFESALDFAIERGGTYVAHFEDDSRANTPSAYTSISITNNRPGHNQYSWYHGAGWLYLTKDQVLIELERGLKFSDFSDKQKKLMGWNDED